MGLIQSCLNRTRTGPAGLYILQVQPTPPLVWDTTPHMFQVTLCNANPPSSTPSGQFKVFISFPGSERGHAESDAVTAQLTSGYNEVSIGPWVPGLENHISACATRPMTQIEVHWNGASLLWLDGKSSVNIPIGCGGNFS